MYFKNCADKYITFLPTLLQKLQTFQKKSCQFCIPQLSSLTLHQSRSKKFKILSSLQKKPLFEDFECPCCNICILFRSYIIYSSFLFVCSLTSNLQNILYYKKLSLKKNTTLPSPPFLKTRKPHQCFIDTN